MDRSAREALQRGMSALADGDRSAFDAVFSALWPVLRRFAERALRDPAAAEDAAIDGDLQAAAAAVFGALRPADSETLLAAARGQREKSSLFRKRLERALLRFRKEWRARHGEE